VLHTTLQEDCSVHIACALGNSVPLPSEKSLWEQILLRSLVIGFIFKSCIFLIMKIIYMDYKNPTNKKYVRWKVNIPREKHRKYNSETTVFICKHCPVHWGLAFSYEYTKVCIIWLYILFYKNIPQDFATCFFQLMILLGHIYVSV
jgi:hypothetical protein